MFAVTLHLERAHIDPLLVDDHRSLVRSRVTIVGQY